MDESADYLFVYGSLFVLPIAPLDHFTYQYFTPWRQFPETFQASLPYEFIILGVPDAI